VGWSAILIVLWSNNSAIPEDRASPTVISHEVFLRIDSAPMTVATHIYRTLRGAVAVSTSRSCVRIHCCPDESKYTYCNYSNYFFHDSVTFVTEYTTREPLHLFMKLLKKFTLHAAPGSRSHNIDLPIINSLSPFKQTSTVLPSCPITPIGRGNEKPSAPTTNTRMTTIANVRFCKRTRLALRA
jgi:hypothetical protein